MAAKLTEQWVWGDTATVVVENRTDAAGVVPLSIAGRTYAFYVGSDTDPLIEEEGVVADASAGDVVFTIPPATYQAVLTSTGQWAAGVVETTGGAQSTILLGTVTMVKRPEVG